jgi:uncharacterized protein with HEPN domain
MDGELATTRDEAACVADIMIEACQRVVDYVTGLDLAGLRQDQRTLDAVARNLEILGEASKRMPSRGRALGPDVPWRELAGIRAAILDDDYGVDVDAVAWLALRRAPALLRALRTMSERIDGGAR